MNLVCAGSIDDHEWWSESILTQHVEEVMGMELDYKIGIPCVAPWCMLCFSAPTRLNRNGKTRGENRKVPLNCQHGDYLETIWRRALTEVLHFGINSQDPTQKQIVGNEQGDGRMGDKRES